jgi:hypothetical protein
MEKFDKQTFAHCSAQKVFIPWQYLFKWIEMEAPPQKI